MTFAERAAELDSARPASFRLRAALRGGGLRVLRARRRQPSPGVRIVHYHHVFTDELRGFARQIALFRREFEPVSLSEAVRRLREGEIGGRELVVTFDDGFRNQLEQAAPLLREQGITGCFFLVNDLLSANAEHAGEICRERLHLPRPVEPLGWDDAPRLLELGHEIGSHTKSHPNLAELRPAELDAELRESRVELGRRLGTAIQHFSAPYGETQRFTPEVSEAARAAGFESCATAQRGVNTSGDDVFALRREHLIATWPAEDARYFLTRS
ncbi:MAG TPA: polysaccharide deacetylase family protein [Gaiellaceae bacterium]